MPRSIRNPRTLHPPPGYGHIAIATGSTLAFVAGQAVIDEKFDIVGGDDLAEQTRQVTRNLGSALDDLGTSSYDLVMATVGVTSLALPELLIEIEPVVSLA